MSAARSVVIVIPCFNEAARLRADDVARLLVDHRVRVLLVDDGSTDSTRALLERITAAGAGRATLLALPRNRGKGEAVRRGLLAAASEGVDVIGYADADFATPAAEILRLLGRLEEQDAQVVLGSRIARLGATIERRALRHYLGRVFATGASLILGLPVYDTQCAAKFFVVTPALRAALAEPFASRWAFDVELLGRLLVGDQGVSPVPAAAFLEEPLTSWRDVSGSKLRPTVMVRAGYDLALINRGLRRRARRSRGGPRPHRPRPQRG